MIKYLIKFVSQLDHAKMLLRGELFMRPASYYHGLEQGQGDAGEALVFHGLSMYKNGEFPIYCFYSVDDSEIQNNRFKVSEKCITDFKCADRYAVLIDFPSFDERIPTLERDGYSLWYDSVSYGVPTPQLSARIVMKNELTNLFIKHQVFAYQKEYRISIGKTVYNSETPMDKRADHVIFKFPSGLDDIAQIVEISRLQKDYDGYVFDLSDLPVVGNRD